LLGGLDPAGQKSMMMVDKVGPLFECLRGMHLRSLDHLRFLAISNWGYLLTDPCQFDILAPKRTEPEAIEYN